MNTNWTPENVTSICQQTDASLTACSPMGMMFLALLTRLYGRATISLPTSNVDPISTQFPNIHSTPFPNIHQTNSPSGSHSHSTFHTPSGVSLVPVHLGPNSPYIEFTSKPPPYSTQLNEPHHMDHIPISYKSTLNQDYPAFNPYRHDTAANHYQNALGSNRDLIDAAKNVHLPNSDVISHQQNSALFPNSNHPPSVGAQIPHPGDTVSGGYQNFVITPRPQDIYTFQNPINTYSVGSGTPPMAVRSRTKRHAQEYDFIVVGGGSAGCVLSNRLSEITTWKILLLEAGPEEPDVTSIPAMPPVIGRSSIDWNYRTQPEKLTCRSIVHRTCAWTRGRTLGGSSAANYMVYMRGNRLDYDNWERMGNPGWSYREVLPYFRRAENNRDIEALDKHYHGVGGPLNVERFPYTDPNTVMLVEAFNQTGLPIVDLNGENNIGTELSQSTTMNGRRWSANMAYIRPIRNVRSNLEIIVNAFVTKIIIDQKTKVAHGVTYFKDGVYYNVYARKEVIISGGSLNSPKLLMLSGIGPRYHLESMNIPVISDLQVGQNLQDHVTTEGLSIALNKTSTSVSGPQLMNILTDYYQQPINHKNGPLSTTSTLNSAGFIKTKYAQENAPDVQFHFDGRLIKDFYADTQTYLQLNVFPLSLSDGLGVRPLLLTPKSRGQVLLNRTDPIFGQPLIYPGFFTVHEDVDVLIEGMRYAISLERTQAFKKNGAYFVRTPLRGCKSHVWGSYDYLYCLLVEYTATIYHPVGTCKMGPVWDKTAVVDHRLRVYGIKQLRVIDGSIMPKIVRGNTNAPIIMIGERASDMIKQDHKQI